MQRGSLGTWTVRAALLGAALVAAGCGGTQPAAHGMRRGESIVHRLAATLYRDARYESDGQAIAQATNELTRRCMRQRGLPFPAVTNALTPPPAPTLPSPRDGYGLMAVFDGVPAAELQAAADPSKSPIARYVAGLTPAGRAAYLRALEGAGSTGNGGCSQRASAIVEGDLDRYNALLTAQNRTGMAISTHLEGDVRLRRAAKRWRTCMVAHGQRDEWPGSIRLTLYAAYLKAGGDLARVRRRELAIAAADRACGLSSMFYEQQDRAQREAVLALSPQQVRATLRWAARRALASRRARAILRQTGRP